MRAIIFNVVVLLLSGSLFGMASESVIVERVPNGGIQPQVLSTSDGTLHAIWYVGAPMAGDLMYARRAAGATNFSTPLRVNSVNGAAVAMGTIRGAHLALGLKDRVHVLWNGSGKSSPRGPDGGPSMLYARLNDAGMAFEDQRQVIQQAGGIDGGGTIVADGRGRVWAIWHASAGATDEKERAVYVALSQDDGATFAAEQRVSSKATGVCGCCGLQAGLDAEGQLSVLYRSAGNGQRDQILLRLPIGKGDAISQVLDAWKVDACPMSTSSITVNRRNTTMAWETKSSLFARFEMGGKPGKTVALSVTKKPGKHPVIAVNKRGEILIAWTEGTGWNKGGNIAWQRYDDEGKEIGAVGRADGLPTWGLVAVAANSDDSFMLLY